MALYNVRMAVVDLIEAPDKEQAIAALAKRLTDAGFDLFEGDHDAFESEEI